MFNTLNAVLKGKDRYPTSDELDFRERHNMAEKMEQEAQIQQEYGNKEQRKHERMRVSQEWEKIKADREAGMDDSMVWKRHLQRMYGMAKSMTDKSKCIRRGKHLEMEGLSTAAKFFFDRADTLGSPVRKTFDFLNDLRRGVKKAFVGFKKSEQSEEKASISALDQFMEELESLGLSEGEREELRMLASGIADELGLGQDDESALEKGKWQRADGSWWQSNPEIGGKPIPWKPSKHDRDAKGKRKQAAEKLDPKTRQSLRGLTSMNERQLMDKVASKLQKPSGYVKVKDLPENVSPEYKEQNKLIGKLGGTASSYLVRAKGEKADQGYGTSAKDRMFWGAMASLTADKMHEAGRKLQEMSPTGTPEAPAETPAESPAPEKKPSAPQSKAPTQAPKKDPFASPLDDPQPKEKPAADKPAAEKPMSAAAKAVATRNERMATAQNLAGMVRSQKAEATSNPAMFGGKLSGIATKLVGDDTTSLPGSSDNLQASFTSVPTKLAADKAVNRVGQVLERSGFKKVFEGEGQALYALGNSVIAVKRGREGGKHGVKIFGGSKDGLSSYIAEMPSSKPESKPEKKPESKPEPKPEPKPDSVVGGPPKVQEKDMLRANNEAERWDNDIMQYGEQKARDRHNARMSRMASSITNPDKALRRGQAMEARHMYNAAHMFYDRAEQLKRGASAETPRTARPSRRPRSPAPSPTPTPPAPAPQRDTPLPAHRQVSVTPKDVLRRDNEMARFDVDKERFGQRESMLRHIGRMRKMANAIGTSGKAYGRSSAFAGAGMKDAAELFLRRAEELEAQGK